MIRTNAIAAVTLSFYLAFGALAPLLPRARAESAVEPNDMNDATPVQSATPAQPAGLRFRLSEGREQQEPPAPQAAPARAEKISDDEARKIFERLPALKADESDEKDFNLRDRSLPAPRTGQTVLAAFPAGEERPAPDAATAQFQVLRHSPVGDVPIAPQMSITFSEPMVAVTSLAELDAQTLPVRLSPQPQGRWRWLGTRTLIFDPAGERLPMATVYTASVPAGTRSANGGTIKSPVTWTFKTPAPQARVMHPQGSPARRDALMFVEFDQKIDPDAVLRTIKLQAGNTNPRLRLATEQEIASDETVKSLAASATAGRWLAFRAVTPANETRDALPGNTGIAVNIGPGTPSAEGPRVTESTQSFHFQTFGPLRVTHSECGYERRCSPFDSFDIYFSNPLAPEVFDASQVRITPELPNANVVVNGSTISIHGAKKARTLYKVTFDPALRDIFGQTLGASDPISFQVGAADASLYSSGGQFVVLDPAGEPRFSVYSVNHASLRVSLYAVTPDDWWRYGSYMRHASGYYDEQEKNKQTTPPGRRVYSKTVKLENKPDELVETRIDLTPALKNGWGQVFVIVEEMRKRKGERETVFAWVQRTRIGLDAFADAEELVGWATSLQDGRPLAGVELRVLPEGPTGTTGGDGVARIAHTEKTVNNSRILLARRGEDEGFLPEQPEWWHRDTGWRKVVPGDHLRWFVFDDRKMYRPGEEVRVKGWMRRVGTGKGGDVGPLAGAAESVSYTLRDSRGNEITKGTTQINALGGFDLTLKLTPTMNLGHAHLQLDALRGGGVAYGQHHAHNFQVQEFRRPEFEVTAKASEGPHFVGSHAQATVSASYYAGGGLPDSQVVWNVTSTPGHFTPPNRDDFTFGKWVPWWEYHDPHGGVTPNIKTHTGKTDAAGRHHLRIDFDGVNPPQPSSVVAEASVVDVNRQTWTSRATMLVHPADLYVGIRSERTFVREGEPFVVESIVTDLDGKAVAGREVRVRAALLEWVYDRGKWSQKEKPASECAVRSGAEAVKCTLQTKGGGVYRVTTRVVDDRDRPNESELTLWVAGGTEPPRRDVAQEKVTLIPDRKEYRAGQVAEVLVQAPFTPAEGVMTLRRSGLVRTERFTMNEPSHLLRIPIDGAYTPNISVQVDLVGSAPRATDAGAADDKLPRRPAFAVGTLSLAVPPHERKLHVVATPREPAVEPGGETTVAVEVKDASGRPVAGSELAVVVVDESVLALSNYRLDDPLAIFYSLRPTGVSDHHLRRSVLLSNPVDLRELVASGKGEGGGTAGRAVGGRDAAQNQVQELVTVTAAETRSPRRRATKIAPSAAPQPVDALTMDRADGFARDEGSLSGDANAAIRMRENFNALAVFAPSVPTDAMGRAEVKVKVPDNLTRYRVMAVSVAGGRQFGSGESAITARMPLMARPSAPRFLNFGDRFELPVVLQNQTDRPAEVRVAVRAANAEMTDGMGRRVTVPANDRVEVRFPVAAMKAGTARFQVGAVTGRHTDAAEISLPVWTPATTEAFATYGELDTSGATVVQPVKAPANVFVQFGGLEVTTSSTQLQALTDAVLYLVAYPYECSEQLSSRVLAVAALKDVLTAFKAKDMPSPDEMKRAVARDIKRLEARQNSSGGFGFWQRDRDEWPYVSIHVAHSLVRAKEKGFEVPDSMLARSREYLRNIERHIPSYYGRQARNTLIAYSLYVRARMNDRDAAKARRLIATEGLGKLSFEAVGWLYAVLSGDAGSRAEVEAIRKLLNNNVTETAGAAHFVTDYSDDNYLLLHSSRRADGIILEALIGDQPQSDLVSKLVRGLLAHRKQGRWENTQENVFILLALDRYFNTYERTTPDFVARAWLGEAFAGEQKFVGRSTDYRQVNVPMRALAEGGATKNLVINKEGQGRLYYRVGMQYAPTSLKLDAADNGFAVERVYEAVDDPADVRREADGTWRVKAGAKVRVRLTMVAPARRYHVALVDPMPAGLEAMNPELAVTASIPPDQKRNAAESMRGWWWWRNWFEHQNMRDERVEAFTSLLWEGVYTYTYVTRATTPGAFVVPPTKAEEMYHPETFGRGPTDRLVVE
ncbi:MAG TPA: alpha-2-macroglobulin family protein [Pyrinomonadaceae bacterium]|nr:alpha-2-macroglobulin family protein [Pyrinomonadaceae bacterium]